MNELDFNEEWNRQMFHMWQEEWPTEIGWYWFFGWQFKRWERENLKPELLPVRVFKTANGIAHVCNGAFMFTSEAGRGLWAQAEIPPLPLDLLVSGG